MKEEKADSSKTSVGGAPPPGSTRKSKQLTIDSFDVKNSFTGGAIELVIKHGSNKIYQLTPENARAMGTALLASADFFDKTR